MARTLFLAALLVGATAPALAGTPDDVKARNAQSWEVLFSEYPKRALAAREEGVVGYKVKLDRAGYATECEVTQPSGHAALDAETCDLILNRATFKGVRDANGRRTDAVSEGTVNWVLPTQPASGSPVASASAKTPAPTKLAASDSEKKICKRHLKTGTLASYERHCLTKAEWDRNAKRTREEWGELQGAKGSTNGR